MSDEHQIEGVVESASKSQVISDEAWLQAITTWIDDHVRNSPIAGFTEAWNHLGGALPHLRTYLEAALRK